MQNDPQSRPVIRSHQDFASGILFIVAGAAFAFLARGYRMGTASSMGPGYFPFWLGMVLVLLGVYWPIDYQKIQKIMLQFLKQVRTVISGK